MTAREDVARWLCGDIVQDLGEAEGSTSGLFMVLEEGYVDIDNACFCSAQDGDAPWTSEWFRLLSRADALLALIAPRPRHPATPTRGEQPCTD